MIMGMLKDLVPIGIEDKGIACFQISKIQTKKKLPESGSFFQIYV
jgi:hypothetical protein